MDLFSEYPVLQGEKIILRKMTQDDVADLTKLTQSKKVYKHLPTFLYEQKYEDKSEVIARMDAECFDTKEALLLGIYPLETPEELAGILEVYSYEPENLKASLGYRLREEFWNKGFATDSVELIAKYLFEVVGIKRITLHILIENSSSERVAEKSGFNKILYGARENWGVGKEDVRVDVYLKTSS